MSGGARGDSVLAREAAADPRSAYAADEEPAQPLASLMRATQTDARTRVDPAVGAPDMGHKPYPDTGAHSEEAKRHFSTQDSKIALARKVQGS